MLLLNGEIVWCHLMSDTTTMSPAGFEPALPKETDLKSVALDHSAKGTFLRASQRNFVANLLRLLNNPTRG
jgi:hypothetical protein